jgi:hypothetical protein
VGKIRPQACRRIGPETAKKLIFFVIFFGGQQKKNYQKRGKALAETAVFLSKTSLI